MKDSHVADDVTRAAVELFATQGYANTSVQQIVDAAGVTKGALYDYFESKDDLLFGIYDRLLSLQKSRLEAIIATGGAVDDVLRAACVDVLETSIDHISEGAVFFRSLHMLSAPRQQEVTRRRRAYHD
jgi:AcrR family transcriptional regulator